MPGLDQLYREIILDHYKHPRNRGELPPPAIKTEGYNPLCGDEVTVYLDIVDGVVNDLKLSGSGCSISMSSASKMSSAVKGKTTIETHQIISAFKGLVGIGDRDDDVKLGDLEALSGVTKFPVRIKCATLAWNTLLEGLSTTATDTATDTFDNTNDERLG